MEFPPRTNTVAARHPPSGVDVSRLVLVAGLVAAFTATADARPVWRQNQPTLAFPPSVRIVLPAGSLQTLRTYQSGASFATAVRTVVPPGSRQTWRTYVAPAAQIIRVPKSPPAATAPIETPPPAPVPAPAVASAPEPPAPVVAPPVEPAPAVAAAPEPPAKTEVAAAEPVPPAATAAPASVAVAATEPRPATAAVPPPLAVAPAIQAPATGNGWTDYLLAILMAVVVVGVIVFATRSRKSLAGS